MAYGIKDFLADLAILNAGAALGPTRVRTAQGYALKKGFQLAALVGTQAVTRGVPAIGRVAARTPVGTGAALGLGALQTPPGQELLAMAEERGRADRDRLQFMLDWFEGAVEDPTIRTQVKQQARRKVSKYQKGVKAGMKAVKQSSFIGKKGTISNAKRAFTTVSKVTSKVNKGKKVSNKGVTGVIARSVRKILGGRKK